MGRAVVGGETADVMDLESSGTSMPLEGVRVVDFGQLLAGPNAAMILAGLGADVIKVEPPGGDAGRELQSAAFAGTSASPSFLAFNCDKRSIELDLKSVHGQDVARRLITRADVVVESSRPGAMARLGLGWNEARELNPRVIYASVSGFGSVGPERQRRGVDLVIQAESGIMSVTGEREGRPLKVGFTVVDVAAGHVLASGILAALLQRERTGHGELVEVSLLEVALHLQAQPLTEYLITGEIPVRRGNAAPMTAPADVVATADGHIVISAYLDDHWRILCRCIDREGFIDDPRFSSKVARVENRDALLELLEEAFSRRSSAEWLLLLQEAGLVVGSVKNYEQIVDSPQVQANQAIVEVTSRDGTAQRVVRVPMHFSSFENSPRLPAPTIGEHSLEILSELGYTREEQPEVLHGEQAAAAPSTGDQVS